MFLFYLGWPVLFLCLIKVRRDVLDGSISQPQLCFRVISAALHGIARYKRVVDRLFIDCCDIALINTECKFTLATLACRAENANLGG